MKDGEKLNTHEEKLIDSENSGRDAIKGGGAGEEIGAELSGDNTRRGGGGGRPWRVHAAERTEGGKWKESRIHY